MHSEAYPPNSSAVAPSPLHLDTLTPACRPQAAADEHASSSDELEEDARDLVEDGRSIIDVSLGPEQSRYMSPTTPAAEKAAVLDGAANDHLFDGHSSPDAATHKGPDAFRTHNSLDAASTRQPERPRPDSLPDNNGGISLPTPWRAGPRQFQGLDGAIFDSWSWSGRSSRARASSTSQGSNERVSEAGQGQGQRKGSRFTLPSLPKITLPNFAPSVTWLHSNERGSNLGSQSPGLSPSSHRPPMLRRSTSDGSLYLQHAMSRASSLGDDSRWTGVHEQVNSRIKALKDSFADSNLKLPRVLPNINLSSSWLDLPSTRKRSSTSPDANHESQQSTPKPAVTRSMADSDAPQAATEANAQSRRSSKLSDMQHPNLTRALKNLRGDVVVLGGYRGSILRSAEPPHRQCWVPLKVGLNLRKVDLEVGLSREHEEDMEKRIFPSGMLQHIGPVDISRRLFKRLRSCENARNGLLRVWDFGYDWRLSPLLLRDRLIKFLEGLPSNSADTAKESRGATVIAHSLGGLITRNAVNQRPELFNGVVYAGVPQTCINILGPLRNGDDVMLSSRVLTAQVNFTIRTSFALLPLDGACFFNRDTKEHFPVDFFDPDAWDEYRLSPCVARPLPRADTPPGRVDSLRGSMASVLPSFSLRRNSSPLGSRGASTPPPREVDSSNTEGAHQTIVAEAQAGKHTVAPSMSSPEHSNPETSVSTAVTLAKEDALAYLRRVLAEVKQFKQELAFKASHEADGLYPPVAAIYGKSIPTVYGAHVQDRDGIKRADAYDNLAFASGDGVVLARAAQVPDGYRVAKGGVVSSDRGHITLLGDLEAVGKALNAIRREARRRGAE